MILTALNQYYDRLAEDVDIDTGKPKVPAFGYSDEKIGNILVLSLDGVLIDVFPHQDLTGKKPVSKQMPVPRPAKRTSGIQPNFLWDKSAYVLGAQANPNKNAAKGQPWIPSPDTFEKFKQDHIDALVESKDDGLRALVKFLEQWNIERIEEVPRCLDVLQTNLAFQLDGDHCYLHEREAAKEAWAKIFKDTDDAQTGVCLVTGKKGKIARLHPSIKGVYGGQSSGGSIVSFNADSYESYGKGQGENAPVSELAAFKYTAALNYLLNRNNNRCLSVGDASTVFWAVAERGGNTHRIEQLFLQTFSPTDDSESAQIKPLVEQLAAGRPLQEIAPDINPNTRFYLLGLAPNAARLSIRYWLDTSFGELGERIAEHYADLALDPLPWTTPPSVWRLLIELAPYRGGQKTKIDDVPPNLAGELMRSILTGNSYPKSMLAQILLRIRSDGKISGLRIALIKAVLHREFRKRINNEDITMNLDENSENVAYQLGRLFAVLERIQSSAIKEANATIADRYFGSASTVPYSVFPRLISGSKNHISKIKKKKPGYAVNLEKDVTAIIGKLPPMFPKHFSIEEQGRFSIGYYHQREKNFNKSEDEAQIETANDQSKGELK